METARKVERREDDRYQIIRRIAQGGMAEIYLGKQYALDGVERTVIIKRILPHYSANDEFITMFMDEARLMAALSHPNIAQVFDVDREDDSYFLVMEYVPGPTVASLLDAARKTRPKGERRLPLTEGLSITLQVAEALEYVHSRVDEHGRPLNIVHRDLNPSNVIVSYEGAVKVIDFGIAKAATKVYETRTGVIKGTFGYMAPEQLSSRSKIDHRADVFALGVLAYEMLLGEHPFHAADEAKLIDKMLNAKFRRPREIDPRFPESLEKLIARCLSPSPAGRPDNVGAFIDELTAYMGSAQMVPRMTKLGAFAQSLVPLESSPVTIPPMPISEVGRQRAGTVKLLNGPAPAMTLPLDDPNGTLGDNLEASDTEIAPLEGMDTVPPPSLPEAVTDPAGAERNSQIDEAHTSNPSLIDRAKSGGYSLPMMVIVVASIALVVSLIAASLLIREAVQDDETITVSEEEPSTSPTRTLRVISDPPGAAITIDGEPVSITIGGVAQAAVTPADVQIPRDRVWVVVALEREGRVPQSRRVQPSVGETTFTLEQQTERPPAPRMRRRRRRPRMR